eukprot:523313_1
MTSIFIAICSFIIAPSKSAVTCPQEDRYQIEQLITTFGYSSTDFVMGRITEQDFSTFFDENLTPDFAINFNGFVVSPLEKFKSFYIDTLKTQKQLNNVIGAFVYISCNESTAIVRNNEIISSIDLATETTPEKFESFHTTNTWILINEENQWKLQ